MVDEGMAGRMAGGWLERVMCVPVPHTIERDKQNQKNERFSLTAAPVCRDVPWPCHGPGDDQVATHLLNRAARHACYRTQQRQAMAPCRPTSAPAINAPFPPYALV
jgi:hypothetical protein